MATATVHADVRPVRESRSAGVVAPLQRIGSLDLVRGAIMVLMAIDHVRVYSGVPAGEFGLEQVIEIGPMSGKSNVVYWLEKRGLEPDETRVNRIYEYAKAAHGVLEESEIRQLL